MLENDNLIVFNAAYGHNSDFRDKNYNFNQIRFET